MFDMQSPFDMSKFMPSFKPQDISKMFDVSALPGFDQSALFDAQKKNLDALVNAQQTAAAGYQDLFEKQVAIFQETMAAAQEQVAELSQSAGAADAAARQTKIAKAAYETAVANVNELAELAQKANADAFEIVKARVEASIEELKSL